MIIFFKKNWPVKLCQQQIIVGMFGYLKTGVLNRLTGSRIIDQIIGRYIVTSYTYKNLKYINDPWTFENTNRFIVVCLFILSHVNNIICTNRTLVTIAIWSFSVSPLYFVSNVCISMSTCICNYILFYSIFRYVN